MWSLKLKHDELISTHEVYNIQFLLTEMWKFSRVFLRLRSQSQMCFTGQNIKITSEYDAGDEIKAKPLTPT